MCEFVGLAEVRRLCAARVGEVLPGLVRRGLMGCVVGEDGVVMYDRGNVLALAERYRVFREVAGCMVSVTGAVDRVGGISLARVRRGIRDGVVSCVSVVGPSGRVFCFVDLGVFRREVEGLIERDRSVSVGVSEGVVPRRWVSVLSAGEVEVIERVCARGGFSFDDVEVIEEGVDFLNERKK